MKNLANLTVIVPSYNRQNLALDTLNFWSKLNLNLSIHLVDGSEKPIENSKLSYLSNNIKYHHINTISEIKRVKKILHLVNTKYCVLGADDDLLLPNALSKSVHFLEKNSDFSSCYGQVLSFKNNDNQNQFYENKPNLKNFALLSEDKNKRLKKNGLKPVHFCILSVMRTNIFKMIFDVNNYEPISYYATLELRANMLVPYFGKCIAIPDLILLRNKNSTPIIHRNNSNISLFKFLFYNNKKKEFELFISSLVKLLDEDKKNAEKIIKKALFYHLFFDIQRYVAVKVPNIIFNNIKFLYLLKRKKKDKRIVALQDLKEFCNKKKIKLDEEDLKVVKEKFNHIKSIK
jgi:glycosyltransferase domain-containing protein